MSQHAPAVPSRAGWLAAGFLSRLGVRLAFPTLSDGFQLGFRLGLASAGFRLDLAVIYNDFVLIWLDLAFVY